MGQGALQRGRGRRGGEGGCVCEGFAFRGEGGEGVRMRLLICDGQGLDDDDARVIAENLNKFKRLHTLNLVSWGRGGEGGGGGWCEVVMCVLPHVV